ncbi:MAG: mandelate racemase/muconate lactonizing enzyme family protein [Ardenticatenales bacterium]|nr:mandelate racemase/muconate lactonizing enzyme family protein [Ardenticatenales bacterium]
MKISKIEIFQLQHEISPSFGWSQGWTDTRITGLVRITTDSGLVGWGEGASGPAAAVIEQLFAPLLLGQDPLNRLGLWQQLFNALYNSNLAAGFGSLAISAIDIALWDIAGKAVDLSVADLLGGRIRDRVAVYATGLYYTEGEFPTRLLDEARSYVDEGFLGMKTKVGGLPWREDVRRVTALREAIGSDVYLAVDANQAYNASTAIRVGRALADLDIAWFEEPVNATDLPAYQQVKAALPLPIAGGECLHTRFAFKDFLAAGALDIAQPDIMVTGGLTEMRRIADMASAFGVLVYPHVWASPIMIAATLQLAATIPPCPPARQPQPFMQEPVMEFDRTPSPIREALSPQPFTQKDGFVAVPDGPGLGVVIDEEVLARLTVNYSSCE